PIAGSRALGQSVDGSLGRSRAMESPSRGLLCLAVLCGLFGAALCLLGSRTAIKPIIQPLAPAGPPASGKTRSFNLKSGEGHIQELAENEVHRYPFFLKAGQVLLVSVDQAPRKEESVDIRVHLQDPSGNPLYDVDHPRGVNGPEEAHLIALASGFYSVEISGSNPGAYRVRFQTRPRASENDSLNARAEAISFQAKRLSDTRLAVEHFLAAGEIWRKAGDKARQADALYRAVLVLATQPKRDVPQELKLGEQVAEIRHSLGDSEGESRVLLYVGDAQKNLGRPGLAESSYRKALALAERQFPSSAAAAARKLSYLFEIRGDRYRALDFLEQSERLVAASNDAEEHWKTLEALGNTYKSLGETDKAFEYFQQCVRLSKMLRRPDLLGKSLSRIGDTYLVRGETKNALSFYELALPLRHQASDILGEAVVLGSMSSIYSDLKEIRKALRLQQEALNAYRQIGDQVNEASAYCNLGLILLDGNDPIQAEQNFERCAERASAQGLRELEITSFYGQAQAQRARNNPQLARLAVGRAIKLLEDVGPREGIENLLVNARIYSYELLIDLIADLPPGPTSQQDKEEAFEASERARWRALLDSLSRDPQRIGLLKVDNAVLADRRSRLVIEIESLENEIHRLDEGSPKATKLKLERKEKSLELRLLESRLRLPSAGAPKPVTVREAQNLLNADTAVLEFFLGRRRSFLFLLTDSDLEIFVLPGRSVLEKACDEYHDLISKSQVASGAKHAETVARRLGGLLLGHAADRLKAKKRLLIIPDGAIHRVPFETLPASFEGELSQQILLDSHLISYVPSLSVLRAIQSQISRRSAPTLDVAVLASPQLGTESSPLPNSRKEGEDV